MELTVNGKTRQVDVKNGSHMKNAKELLEEFRDPRKAAEMFTDA